MGLFDLFGKKNSEAEEKSQVPWYKIERTDQLDELISISRSTPVVVFKHSTRCGISRMVLRQFESSYDIPESQMKLFYLDLLSHRDISNEIARRFQVIHQSPQLLVIRNGNTVAQASHYGVNQIDLTQFL